LDHLKSYPGTNNQTLENHLQQLGDLNTTSSSMDLFPEVHLSEALINKNHLVHNLNLIKNTVGPKCTIMGIVKANAYGHNVKYVSQILLQEGLRSFGVANINEAIELREHILNHNTNKQPIEILAFASPLPDQYPYYLNHGIDITLTDYETFQHAETIAKANNMPMQVHLKVDTGMGRLGIDLNHALDLAERIENSPYLHLKAIYSHFASSGEDLTFSQHQLQNYQSLVSEFEHMAGRSIQKHMANSGAIVSDKKAHFDMVRPGILLYGYTPGPAVKTDLSLKPVMQFQSRVTFIKWLEKGQSVSYGRLWQAEQPTRIATISVGYADGYHRSLTNKASVQIRGKHYRQIGAVTMDQIMVALDQDAQVEVGDEAVLFGWHGIDAGHLAQKINTISYELLCSVSPRVKRVLVDQ
jgi:alanine racemase